MFIKSVIFFAFVLINMNSIAQHINFQNNAKLRVNYENEQSYHKSSASGKILWPLGYAAIAAFVINPIVVFENKKVYFGLTKEISIGKYPYGRVGFEYSYIFRDSLRSHLRFSYNYDIILEAGDFMAFLISPGSGFFTDTKNHGWFGHASLGMLFAADEFALNPYLRYRFTYLNDKKPGKTNIHDVSLGMGLAFYF